jgi:hypothetical protein
VLLLDTYKVKVSCCFYIINASIINTEAKLKMTVQIQAIPVYEDGQSILVDEGRTKAWADRHTPSLLEQEPWRIRKMNSVDCTSWMKRHHNKRVYPTPRESPSTRIERISLKPIRDKIIQRQRDIAFAKNGIQRGRDLDIDMMAFFDALTLLTDQMRASTKQKYNIERICKRFCTRQRHTIWEMPFVPLGLWSVEAITAHEHKANFKATNEHCFPRTKAVYDMVKWCWDCIQKDPTWVLSIAHLVRKCFEACGVVSVTKEENQRLVPFQKTLIFTSPEDTYQQAGIDVVRTGQVVIPYAWKFVAEAYLVDLDECSLPVFNNAGVASF